MRFGYPKIKLAQEMAVRESYPPTPSFLPIPKVPEGTLNLLCTGFEVEGSFQRRANKGSLSSIARHRNQETIRVF